MEKAEIELDRKIRLIEAEMKLRAQTNQVNDDIISNHSELMHQLTKLQNDYIKRSRTTQP